MDVNSSTGTYEPSEQLVREIRTRFMYHPPRPDQLPRYDELRRNALELALRILHVTPPGREQSLALTKLEEAVMHANSAIARGEAPKP
jgi:hypothetical protein